MRRLREVLPSVLRNKLEFPAFMIKKMPLKYLPPCPPDPAEPGVPEAKNIVKNVSLNADIIQHATAALLKLKY